MQYYDRLAAAYVRGHVLTGGGPELSAEFLNSDLEALTAEQMAEIIQIGQKAELKLYRFKTNSSDLPRVRKVLGFLRGIFFESLLDVGSGRGVFLFPFLAEFPWIEVTSLDILPYRAEFLQEITAGGVGNLTALQGNICEQPLPDHSRDVVTLLEVLEHIPDVQEAVRTAVRIARKFVVVSVPSKPDDNPEHIHLLTKDRLTALFEEAGCTRLSFDGVNGHLIMVAVMEQKEP